MQTLLCNYSEYSIRSSFNASPMRNQALTSQPPPTRLLALNFGLSRKLGTMTHWCSDGPLGQDRPNVDDTPAGGESLQIPDWDCCVAECYRVLQCCRSQTEIADSAASKMQRHRARDAFQTPRCVFIINRPLRLFCSLLLALAPLSKCQIFHHRETTFFRMNSFCFAYEFHSWIHSLALGLNG